MPLNKHAKLSNLPRSSRFLNHLLTHRSSRWVAVLMLLVSFGCEKVVDLDLKTSPAQLVIEANLLDDNRPCQVSLATSTDYASSAALPPVTGATITLADKLGGHETLREISAGQYVGTSVKGVPGHTYTLRVEANGATYVASSTLPAPVVPFDKLSTQVSVLGNNILAVVDYTDPPGLGNSYLFRQYRNGRLTTNIFVQNDQFIDGKHLTQALLNENSRNDPSNPDKLAAGDSLVVEMQNVDPGVYEYFRTLNQILATTAAPSTTPANPQSNFTGGALGYFSAHSRRLQRIKIQ